MLGVIVYVCVILIANVEILNATNNHTWIGFLILIFSIGSFFATYFILNEIDNIDELYRTYGYFKGNPLTYLVIFFVIGMVSIYQKVIFVTSKLKNIYKVINTRKKLL